MPAIIALLSAGREHLAATAAALAPGDQSAAALGPGDQSTAAGVAARTGGSASPASARLGAGAVAGLGGMESAESTRCEPGAKVVQRDVDLLQARSLWPVSKHP